jgi:hypothetical protein
MNLPLLHRRWAGIAKIKFKEKTQLMHDYFIGNANQILDGATNRRTWQVELFNQ